MRIAFLDDDLEQADRVTALLHAAGHSVHFFARGGVLLRELRTETFDLVILDWEVPDISGYEVLHAMRTQLRLRTPVLFLTHRDGEADVVEGLRAGADDFLVKPPRERELLARVETLGRRVREVDDDLDVLEAAPYSIDVRQGIVSRDGAALPLTRREFEVAALLFRNIGKVLSRGHIMEAVWARSQPIGTRTVDMHVSRVRTVLGLSPAIGWRLTAVYGYGYRLDRVEKATP